jgi:hypothetical protein
MSKLIYILIFVLALSTTVSSQESAPNTTTSGTLSVTVTTTTYNGSYSPNNIVAIWIVNGSGTYVKTLAAYCATRTNDLINWIAANSSKDKTDAITGATRNSHGQITATWNGTNKSGVLQADGNYTLKMEMTEGGNNKIISVPFAKGSTTDSQTPANVTGFSNISVNWIPTTTGINNPESEKYSLYPNPTRSTVYVSGFDIQQTEVLTLSGKLVFSTNNKNIDLSTLPKGIYLLKLKTDTGTFFKKVEKI